MLFRVSVLTINEARLTMDGSLEFLVFLLYFFLIIDMYRCLQGLFTTEIRQGRKKQFDCAGNTTRKRTKRRQKDVCKTHFLDKTASNLSVASVVPYGEHYLRDEQIGFQSVYRDSAKHLKRQRGIC